MKSASFIPPASYFLPRIFCIQSGSRPEHIFLKSHIFTVPLTPVNQYLSVLSVVEGAEQHALSVLSEVEGSKRKVL
jgi:hypothetical protein